MEHIYILYYDDAYRQKAKNLYTIVFETEKEVITDRVGIREIHIENRVVYFNGKR